MQPPSPLASPNDLFLALEQDDYVASPKRQRLGFYIYMLVRWIASGGSPLPV